MRVISSMESKDLLKKLAGGACKCEEHGHTILAADSPSTDTKDEAKQCAIMYWTMGWTWDEIETVLEDSEFPKSMIADALKAAKAYAKEILNKGPFSNLKEGQYVKLKSGSYGTLESAYEDHVQAIITGVGRAKIPVDQLDMIACEKLSIAFDLRKQAEDNVTKAYSDVVNVRSFRVDANNLVEESLNKLQALQKAGTDLSQEGKLLWEQLHTKKSSVKATDPKEREFVQVVSAIIEQEADIEQMLQSEVFGKFSHELAKYADLIQDATADASAVNEFITSKLPETLNIIDAHRMLASDKNEKIRNGITQLAKFSSTPDSGTWLDTIVSEASEGWKETEAFFDKVSKDVLPTIEEGSAIIAAYLDSADKQKVAMSVNAALKSRV